MRFGLQLPDGTRLQQIAGGGRIRLQHGERKWWTKPPKDANWSVVEAEHGQTYETKDDAEAVIANLTA